MNRLDILNREEFVAQLVNLTNNISHNKLSVAFAIDGTWGCGKSFVLDMYEDQLKVIQSEETGQNQYLIVRYNCWKYDYYEEPLIAIVATMLESIEQQTQLLHGEQGEKVKGLLKVIGTTLLTISNNAIKEKTGIDLSEAAEFIQKGVESGEESYKAMHQYDMYFEFNKTLHSLQSVLNDLGEQYTVVFLIDELDRCLPEYAIKVLERLHHLTENTKNVITIMAIDKTQLQSSITHIFGFENPEDYLKKFIQFTVPLPIGTVSDKFMEKHRDYIELFDSELFEFYEPVEECLQAIFMEIDVREQEQLVNRAKLAHTLLYTESKDYSFMCMELLITTLICYYGNDLRIKNNQFVYNLSLTFAKDRDHKPYFSDFFHKKFEDALTEYSNGFGKSYALPHNASLYAAIIITWHWLQRNAKIAPYTIQHTQGDIYQPIVDNINEFKKFIDMVYLIK